MVVINFSRPRTRRKRTTTTTRTTRKATRTTTQTRTLLLKYYFIYTLILFLLTSTATVQASKKASSSSPSSSSSRTTKTKTKPKPTMEKTAKNSRNDIGGGAINERERHFTSDTTTATSFGGSSSSSNNNENNDGTGTGNFFSKRHRSHLMHVIEGLYRYPNYLSRWSSESAIDDIELVEESLLEQLQLVRQQKESLMQQKQQYREIIHRHVLTRYPEFKELLLQKPKNWNELLYQRNILHDDVCKVIIQSKYFSFLRKEGGRKGKNNKKKQKQTTTMTTTMTTATTVEENDDRDDDDETDNNDDNDSSFPTLEDVLNGKEVVELDVSYLAELIDEECFDTYSFPLLSNEFCNMLTKYITCVMDIIREINTTIATANDDDDANDDENDDDNTTKKIKINKDLDLLGLGWLNDVMLHLIMRPLSAHLYKESELCGGVGSNGQTTSTTGSGKDSNVNADLDWRQGYIAAYSARPNEIKTRQSLVPHTDDSEVTLNICVGDENNFFTGGLLQFWGLRNTENTTQKNGRDNKKKRSHTLLGEYQPQIGRGVIHSGRHLHEVTEVTSGDRYAYIVWARSWRGTRAVTCPCCWLNRRTDGTCISGPRWN